MRFVIATFEHETNTFSPLPLEGVGVTSSDNGLFNFERVRRPIYPLDAINEP